MGQAFGKPLPLPRRIPRPSNAVSEKLQSCNIIVNDNPKSEYLTYTLPDGWKMVDDSWREDLPEFRIIDHQEMIHFTISGAWKGTYDNKIEIYTVETPTKYMKRYEKIIPSETKGEVLVGKILDAVISNSSNRSNNPDDPNI